MGKEDGDSNEEAGQINIFTGEIESFEKGKDELNLAEFPISVVAESARPGQLTLTFADTIKDKSTGEMVERSVTIMGTEKWGLPAAQDDDVMVGLLQLCYLSGWPKTIRFTRYQLCKILRWSVGGASYQRIYKALHRLSTTNYNYRYAWRDRSNQEWIPSQVFSYIQALKVHEADRPTDSGLCEVTWSDDFHRSLEAGNLKTIDFGLFVGLKKSISKRLYRFLDKRFGGGWTTITYKLDALAFEKIGISRSYTDAAQVKRLLLPAIKELETVGYLEPLPAKERFTKVSRGVWEVVFEKRKVSQKRNLPKLPPTNKASPIETRLIESGIFPAEARKFVVEFPKSYLEEKLDQFPFRSAQKNPPGLLADSIRRNLPAPSGYQPPEERSRAEAETREKQEQASRREVQLRKREEKANAEEERERQLAETEFGVLPVTEQERLKAKARLRFPKSGPDVIRLATIQIFMQEKDLNSGA